MENEAADQPTTQEQPEQTPERQPERIEAEFRFCLAGAGGSEADAGEKPSFGRRPPL